MTGTGDLGTVFGLCVHEGSPARPVSSPAPACGPRCVWIDAARAEDVAAWRDGDAVRAVEARTRHGGVELAVDVHPKLGYRLSGNGEPTYLVSADGTSIRRDTRRPRYAPGQRLLNGQVLPLAAILQGLEVLHASAVAIAGRVLAFSGPSGAGKTSLAVRLAARGHPFLTDDVLAVEAAGAGLLAHPGPSLAHLRPGALRGLRRDGGLTSSALSSAAGGTAVLPGAERDPRPLEALYLLRRGAGQPSLRRLDTPDPRRLLAATFNLLDRRPERLVALLDACARLARSARVVELTSAEGADLDELAELVEADARRTAAVA